jgi:hypothetical protein
MSPLLVLVVLFQVKILVRFFCQSIINCGKNNFFISRAEIKPLDIVVIPKRTFSAIQELCEFIAKLLTRNVILINIPKTCQSHKYVFHCAM